QRHVNAADAGQPGEVQSGRQDTRRDKSNDWATSQQAEPPDGDDATKRRRSRRKPYGPVIHLSTASPRHRRDGPVIQRRVLQFELAVKESRKAPGAFENGLGILSSAAFMAVPQVAIVEPIKEEE